MMTFQFFVSVYAAPFFLPRRDVVFPPNLFLISRVDLKHASIESLFGAVEGKLARLQRSERAD